MKSKDSSQDWHQQKTYESMIMYGANAIKFVFLSNGGAILSILTFLGTHPDRVCNIKPAIIWLLLGVIVGGIANLTVYCTQLSLFNERGNSVHLMNNHRTWLFTSLVLIMFGIICFAVGAFLAIEALQ